MSFDILQEKIREKKNPTVAGLDARIEYVPEHIRKAAFAQYGVGLKGACEAIWQFNVYDRILVFLYKSNCTVSDEHTRFENGSIP